jgi:hypothetical protein
MSPKLVFEEAYSELYGGVAQGNFGNPHQVRVKDEAAELYAKEVVLGAFIESSDIFLSLNSEEQVRMKQQHMAMKAYLSCLNSRIEAMPQVEFKNRYVAPMNFGQAVEALKKGAKVARTGWNGKEMFLYLVPGSTFSVNRPPLNEIYPEGTEITYRPHMDLKTADGSVATWSPSGSDALAEDWVIVD